MSNARRPGEGAVFAGRIPAGKGESCRPVLGRLAVGIGRGTGLARLLRPWKYLKAAAELAALK